MIRSTKILRHARGQPCTLRFEGCDGGGETTVSAHIRDANKGMGTKASDLSICFACRHCHDLLDHHPHQIPKDLFYWHQLRAIDILARDGVIIVPQDIQRPSEVKPRKPKSQRAKIPSRPFQSARKFGH